MLRTMEQASVSSTDQCGGKRRSASGGKLFIRARHLFDVVARYRVVVVEGFIAKTIIKSGGLTKSR